MVGTAFAFVFMENIFKQNIKNNLLGENNMAKEPEENQESEDDDKKSGSSTLKIVIIAVSLALVLGGGLVGATFYFVSNMNAEQASTAKDGKDGAEAADEDEEEEEVAESEPVEPPQYHSMDPKFVVSFSDQSKARFMQFSVEVMTRDSDVIKHIETHMPVIRSSLLMLFGNQAYEDMVTREGKEKLLSDVTADINTVLEKLDGQAETESLVEAAYFNSFVIQ